MSLYSVYVYFKETSQSSLRLTTSSPIQSIGDSYVIEDTSGRTYYVPFSSVHYLTTYREV